MIQLQTAAQILPTRFRKHLKPVRKRKNSHPLTLKIRMKNPLLQKHSSLKCRKDRMRMMKMF